MLPLAPRLHQAPESPGAYSKGGEGPKRREEAGTWISVSFRPELSHLLLTGSYRPFSASEVAPKETVRTVDADVQVDAAESSYPLRKDTCRSPRCSMATISAGGGRDAGGPRLRE